MKTTVTWAETVIVPGEKVPMLVETVWTVGAMKLVFELELRFEKFRVELETVPSVMRIALPIVCPIAAAIAVPFSFAALRDISRAWSLYWRNLEVSKLTSLTSVTPVFNNSVKSSPNLLSSKNFIRIVLETSYPIKILNQSINQFLDTKLQKPARKQGWEMLTIWHPCLLPNYCLLFYTFRVYFGHINIKINFRLIAPNQNSINRRFFQL